ncbi:hypothetical protein LJB85_03410 [Porphyromonadaceae bacterium OttesenSCG-928-L07]|nr:hypothetical protein [Porphyromonadaceae bacterium OttesenSCG-928-L07]MDL2251357.1 hypothetical protein [Odoribacter sp. OttesenSCG-928-J03]MDL2331346.1 hypothetical protein [Odoribacter sp. OttesenSCG-928-A06]
MNVSRKSFWSAFAILLHSVTGLTAQENTNNEALKHFPAQISFVYPMTTQGNNTVDYSYSLSLNMLMGRVGALNGIGFGGLYNRVDQHVRGVLFGGLYNQIGKSMTGVQAAGLLNMTGENVRGAQLSGLANMSSYVNGIQFAGITNIAKEVNGLQVGGVINLSEHSRGFRFAGITNVSDSTTGFQLAGVANITHTTSGTGAALINRTKVLKGVNLGLINIIDTIESGASLALINVVRKGAYKEWEFSFSDYSNVSVSYKVGVKKLYTIYTLGGNFLDDRTWNAGVGIGNRTSISKRFDIQPELITYVYFPEDFKMKGVVTSVNRFKLGLIYNLNEKLALSFAPSIYSLNSDIKEGVEDLKISSVSPFTSKNYTQTRSEIGFGFSLGLLLR